MLNNAAPPELHRPTTVAEMRQRMALMLSEAGRERANRFQPLPSDVIIATYPKSGTTWMQQIVHGLRTGGSMDFSEITEVIPWIEFAYDLGQDIDADQVAEPRAFKSHRSGQDVQGPCRYITAMRDPKAVAVSSFHFLQGWAFEPGSISIETYMRDHYLQGGRSGRYWPHLISWWERRDEPDTLFLCYEDMRDDLAGAVRRVADFLGMAERTDAIDIATRQADIGFMRAHQRQFDDHLIHDARDAVCGLPPSRDTAKVSSAAHKVGLTPGLEAMFDDLWRTEIEAVLGFSSYADMRAALNA